MGIAEPVPAGNGHKTRYNSPAKRMENLKIFGRLVRLMGLRPQTAFRFWKNIFMVRKRNPSRLVRYLENCSFAANLFLLRDEIQKRSVMNM
jgi:hypothetical protein